MTVPLANLETGQIGTLERVEGGRAVIARLAALGFTPGAEIRMVRNYGHGPIIVSVRGAQVALGRGEAGRVWVRSVEERKE